MANKAFMDETKKVFKNTSASSCKFWKSLEASEDVQNIYHFCMKLFEAVTTNSKDQFLDDQHEAMYSTLMLLEFYKNTKLKPERWLQETEKIFEETKPKIFEHARWIIKLYLRNNQQHQFAINFISSTVHIPEKLVWNIQPGQQINEALEEASEYQDNIELKRRDKPYKKLTHLAFDEPLKQSKITSFGYCCFLDYIRSCNYQINRKVWLHVADNLKGLIHALRFTSSSYRLLTVYLHLLNNMLKYYGCHYQDILKDCIYLVNIIRHSPGYNAQLAEQVFETIHGELKFPGNAFRRELRRKFVNVDIKRSQKLGSKKYLLSYRRTPFPNQQFCTVTNLRKLIIYNVLACSKIDSISTYWSVIQPLDADTTYDLYFKVSKILDITNNLQTYQSIQKLVRQSLTELFKLTWKPYRKLHKEQQIELNEILVEDNSQKYFQFPNFEIFALKPQDLIQQGNMYALIELFEEARQYPYNQFFYSQFIEFIFYGNDEELSKIIQMFCTVLIDLPPNQYQKVQFYILPTTEGSCSLAEYLSFKDIWYKRHIYNIFRQRMLFPYASPQDPQIKDTFPMYLYSKSLHMYLRQAQRKTLFQLFQCDLCLIDKEGHSQTKTMYFVNHVLIGASMQAILARNELKKEKKQGQHTDALDLYLQKIKRVSNIIVDINARYKVAGTELLVTKQQKNIAIEDLQICNTPKPYFFGYKPNPTSQFLQVSILNQIAGKTFRTELQSKENFKRYSDLEISEAFRDLFINITVESIVIQRAESMRETMKIMIDGVEIADVDKLKITPAYTSSNLPMGLPVRSFLPFQAQ